MGIIKRMFRAVVGVAIPMAINFAVASPDPYIQAAVQLIGTSTLMGIGKWLRDKFKVPYVPV